MSEKWLISHCEGYGVRIDEQAPVIEHCTIVQALVNRGFLGGKLFALKVHPNFRP